MSIKPLRLTTVDNRILTIPDGQHLFHLQFRRFAGCPVCSLHLRSFVSRRDDLQNINLREIIFFHSRPEDIRKYLDDLPFDVVADPHKKLYTEFGVSRSLLSVTHPKAMLTILMSVSVDLYRVIFHRAKMPPLLPHGGSLGLPGDFLIDKSGKVLAVRYGSHADDQWSVDELLAIVKSLENQ